MFPVWHHVSDRGPRRHRNEDVTFVVPATRTAGVVDGIGGNPRGDRAAALAANLLGRPWPDGEPVEAMRLRFHQLNVELMAASASEGLPEPMGCVATCVRILRGQGGRDRLVIGHVGDTRAFLFDKDGAGNQLTRDHSVTAHQGLPEALAMAAPQRNLIARGIGLAPVSPQDLADWVDVVETDIAPGQLLLLCTDGISDYVDRGTLSAVVARHPDALRPLVDELVRLACESQLRSEGGDNYGVVVLRWPTSPATAEHTNEPPTPWPNSLWSTLGRGLPWALALISTLALLLIGVLLILWAHRRTSESRRVVPLVSWTPGLTDLVRDRCTERNPSCLDEPLEVKGIEGPSLLCGEWPDAALVATGIWELGLCDRMMVPTDGRLIFKNLVGGGSGPERLVIDDRARLELREVDLTLDHATTWTLGKEAILSIQDSEIVADDVKIELGANARLVVSGSVLTLGGQGPLIHKLGEGARVELVETELDLGPRQLFDSQAPPSAVESIHAVRARLLSSPAEGSANQALHTLSDSPDGLDFVTGGR